MKLLLLAFLITTPVFAKKVKLAFLAPEGTNWANSLSEMGKEIKKATDGRVKFKMYFGGVQGDEADVLRKIRSGQLHGGIFTGKTLGDIYPDSRVMEIPFTFTEKQEAAQSVLDTLTPDFNSGFQTNGFHSLGMYEIGHVYLVSTKKITNLNSLKGLKIWIWEGDKIVEAMMQSLNLVSVPLALPDVLSSLSTGVIEAAYAPPLGITALQWHTKVKYLVDYPVAYSIGSLLISSKVWKKIKPADQKVITEIAQKKIAVANELTAKENKRTLAQFKELGIEFVHFPKSDYAKSSEIRKDVLTRLNGKMFSKPSLSKFDGIIQKL